jgi:hypothetical protein
MAHKPSAPAERDAFLPRPEGLVTFGARRAAFIPLN